MPTSVSKTFRWSYHTTKLCNMSITRVWGGPDGCNGTDVLVEWEVWNTPGCVCVGGSGPTKLKNKSSDDILGADVWDSLKSFI